MSNGSWPYFFSSLSPSSGWVGSFCYRVWLDLCPLCHLYENSLCLFPFAVLIALFLFHFLFYHSVRSLRILDNSAATVSLLLQKPINDLKGTADSIHLDVLVSAVYGCSHPFQAGGSYIHSSGTDLPRLRLFIKTFADLQAVSVPFSSPSVFPSLANFIIDTLPISFLGQSYRTSLFLLIHCQVNGQMCLLHFSSLFQSCT